MKPRNSEAFTTEQTPAANRKPRFQIVKLEERIAPRCSAHYNPKGKVVGHYSSRECGYGGR